MMVQNYDTWHNEKIATWYINYIFKNKNKNIYFSI